MVYPRTVTHPSTNRARRRATTLIKTNALPLRQAATLVANKGYYYYYYYYYYYNYYYIVTS